MLRQLASSYSLLDANETTNWVASSGAEQFIADLSDTKAKAWVLTGSFAASRLVSVTAPEVAVVFADDPERIATLTRLRQVRNGGNVVIARPYDQIVFERTWTRDSVVYASVAHRRRLPHRSRSDARRRRGTARMDATQRTTMASPVAHDSRRPTMTDELRIEYVEARRVLLDALTALRPHLDAVVLIGAQAVYLRTAGRLPTYQPFTTDADLVIDPGRLADVPLLGDAMADPGFELPGEPGIWQRRLQRPGFDGEVTVPVDLIYPQSLHRKPVVEALDSPVATARPRPERVTASKVPLSTPTPSRSPCSKGVTIAESSSTWPVPPLCWSPRPTSSENVLRRPNDSWPKTPETCTDSSTPCPRLTCQGCWIGSWPTTARRRPPRWRSTTSGASSPHRGALASSSPSPRWPGQPTSPRL